MSLFIDPTGATTFGLGICARCSRKMKLEDLYDDPNAPGLKVCLDDLDDFDPYRLAARPTEEINLLYSRPDRRIDDVDGDPSTTLLYTRSTSGNDTNIRITQSGDYREIEQAPDGGIPPWVIPQVP